MKKPKTWVCIDASNFHYYLVKAGWQIDWVKFKTFFESRYDFPIFFYYEGVPSKSQYFDIILGGCEDYKLKPDPAMLNIAMSETDSSPELSWIIGDNYTDLESGRIYVKTYLGNRPNYKEFKMNRALFDAPANSRAFKSSAQSANINGTVLQPRRSTVMLHTIVAESDRRERLNSAGVWPVD